MANQILITGGPSYDELKEIFFPDKLELARQGRDDEAFMATFSFDPAADLPDHNLTILVATLHHESGSGNTWVIKGTEQPSGRSLDHRVVQFYYDTSTRRGTYTPAS